MPTMFALDLCKLNVKRAVTVSQAVVLELRATNTFTVMKVKDVLTTATME